MKGTIEFKIKKQYSTLTKSEKRTADFILDNIESLKYMPITALAERAGVSQPTIIRFVRSIGYEGYTDFRLALAEERGNTSPKSLYGFSLDKKDRLEDIPAKITKSAVNRLENALKALDIKAYKRAVDAIVTADRILLLYVENSCVTAYDLSTKLAYLGISCLTYDDNYLQSVSAGNLKKGDLAIAISYTGCSKNTVDCLKKAKRAGATTLVVTNFAGSLISEIGDIVLTGTEEQLLYGDAIFSRVSQLAVVDMLYTGVILSDYKKYTSILEGNSSVMKERAYNNDDES